MGAAVVRTWADALALVQGAGAPNGGLAIDIWHLVNLGIPFEAVAQVPREFLACVELNDARDPQTGNPSENRLFCGEGDLNVRGFIEAIRTTGFDGPWGVELFSDDLVSMDLTQAATRAAQTARGQFR